MLLLPTLSLFVAEVCVASSLPPIVSVGNVGGAKKDKLKSSQTNPSKKKRKNSVSYGQPSRRVGQMTEQVMKAYGVPKGYAMGGSSEVKAVSDNKYSVSVRCEVTATVHL
jgi:hypothetical protein